MTDWYKQDVYDPNNAKIGQIMDVLVDKSGKISALTIGIGGFLDAGEKDVAVTFEEVQATTKNNKVHLVMNATKDALQKRTWFQVRQQHHDLGCGFQTKSDPHRSKAGLGAGSDFPDIDAPSVQKCENCRRASALSSDECGNT